ncbi:hypothetical protein BJ165DRAFT_350511 [Panaeolus papilionaceus]|nr:hypothetical protein BJ165DRAFT_350511 [Panaeolus papilionaceus]
MSITCILDILAPELLHEVISFLPLPSLLVIRSVCTTFRDIVLFSTRISHSRASLLKLFIRIVNSPAFLQTRPWTIANLTRFDRTAYIDHLESRTCSHHRDRITLPPEFKTWVLEWPGQASFGSAWPGLPPHDYAGLGVVDGIQRLEGKNWLGSHPPQVSALAWRNETPEVGWAPGILVWKRDGEATWLVCRCNCESKTCNKCQFQETQEVTDNEIQDSSNALDQWFGKVVIAPKRPLGYNQLESASASSPEIGFDSWSTFLEETWKSIERKSKDRVQPLEFYVEVVSSNWSTGVYPDLGMYYDPGRLDIPAPRWDERNLPQHQTSLFNF